LEKDQEPSANYQWHSEEELEKSLFDKHQKENSIYGKWKAYWAGKHPLEWAVFIFTVLAFGAAAVAAVYTGREWHSMKTQTAVMQDQEQRQLRGYIYTSVKSAALNGSNGTVDISYNTIGQTPIYHVHVAVTGEFSCGMQGINVPKPGGWQKEHLRDVYFPDQNDTWDEVDISIDQDEVNKLKTGNCSAVIFGEILYLDAFLAPHFTTFCYLWNPESADTGTTHLCPTMNGSDGEKANYQDILQNPKQPNPWGAP
jgi:hypothetical protein